MTQISLGGKQAGSHWYMGNLVGGPLGGGACSPPGLGN